MLYRMNQTDEQRIRTSYDPKPIPVRDFDWTAWLDGDEEVHNSHGATEEQAIEALHEYYVCIRDVPEEPANIPGET